MIWICGRVCATDQRWDLTGHQEGSSVFEKLLLLLDVICAVVWETNPWFNNTHTHTQLLLRLYFPINMRIHINIVYRG